MTLQPMTRIECLFRGTLYSATVVEPGPWAGLYEVDLDIPVQVLMARGDMRGTRATIRQDDIVTVFE